jgi:drug/metabolite transporter (DMT)-like permease
MTTWVMILGEALCFIPYYFEKKTKSNDKSGKLPATISIYFVPLFLDLLCSNLSFIGLNYVSGSVYSIMHSSVVVFNAILSKLILKSTFRRPQVLGGLLMIFAAVISGLAQFI